MTELTEKEQELLKECKQACEKLELTIEKITPENFMGELQKKNLELRYKDDVPKDQSDALQRLNEQHEQIERLLRDKKQAIINLNRQTLQQVTEAVQDQQMIVRNSAGDQVAISIPSSQNTHQQSPNVAFRLPTLTMGAGSVGQKVKDISETAAREIADQQKPPLTRQVGNTGQVQYGLQGQNLNPQQQNLQALFNQKLMDMLKKSNLTATQQTLGADKTQQAQQQQSQQASSATKHTPLPTKLIPPGTAA